MQQLVELRAYLESVHPRLPLALAAIVVGGVIWGWRKVHPASFAKLPQRWQGMPAVAFGAALAALSSGGDMVAALADAMTGAGVGLAAVGGHHAVVKRMLSGAKAAS